MDFVVQIGGRSYLEYLGGIRGFLKDKRAVSSRQLLRVLREKQEFFLYLKKASSTHQVLEAKRLCSGDSHSKLSKRETCVNLFLEYQELTRTP